MNIKDPKELFFNYDCNFESLLKDTGLSEDDQIIKTIIINKEKYIEQYHKIKLEIIRNCDYIEILVNEISKYRNSCFNYDDVYKLVDTLYYIIIEKLIFDDMLFSVYYGIFIYNKNGFINKDNFKEDNLLIYMKNNYKDFQYKKSKIEEVISKDINDTPLKDLIKKALKEI